MVPAAVGQFALRALSTNPVENLFSRLVQVTGGYKPHVRDVVRLMTKVERLAATAMLPPAIRGFFYPHPSLGKRHYKPYLLDFNSGVGDQAGAESSERHAASLAKKRSAINHARESEQQPIRTFHIR